MAVAHPVRPKKPLHNNDDSVLPHGGAKEAKKPGKMNERSIKMAGFCTYAHFCPYRKPPIPEEKGCTRNTMMLKSESKQYTSKGGSTVERHERRTAVFRTAPGWANCRLPWAEAETPKSITGPMGLCPPPHDSHADRQGNRPALPSGMRRKRNNSLQGSQALCGKLCGKPCGNPPEWWKLGDEVG